MLIAATDTFSNFFKHYKKKNSLVELSNRQSEKYSFKKSTTSAK